MKRKAGQANVEEHPKGSGRYRVRARADGKLKLVVSGVSRAEAEEAAAAFTTIRNESALREGVTLTQFGVGFLYRRGRLGIRAIKADVNRWKLYIDKDPIGALPVSSLGRRDVLEWLDRRDLAHQTRKNALNLLRVALQEAVDRELLSANPARDVRVHRAGAARAIDGLEGVLTPAEQQALVAAVPERERPVVVFALCTGLRQAEQWWLKWEDVGADRVLVRRSVGGLAPKSGKPREVFLLPPALLALETLKRRSEFVFAGARGCRRGQGKPPKRWRTWLRAAGITRRIRWHDLRHTCATSLLAGWWGRRWKLDEVCQMLGHSSVTVTERYARKLSETQKLAVSETPVSMFPGGNITPSKLAIPQADGNVFVNRRSRVQIPKLAPALTGAVGERAGNSQETAPIAVWALVEAAERLRLKPLSRTDPGGVNSARRAR